MMSSSGRASLGVLPFSSATVKAPTALPSALRDQDRPAFDIFKKRVDRRRTRHADVDGCACRTARHQVIADERRQKPVVPSRCAPMARMASALGSSLNGDAAATRVFHEVPRRRTASATRGSAPRWRRRAGCTSSDVRHRAARPLVSGEHHVFAEQADGVGMTAPQRLPPEGLDEQPGRCVPRRRGAPGLSAASAASSAAAPRLERQFHLRPSSGWARGSRRGHATFCGAGVQRPHVPFSFSAASWATPRPRPRPTTYIPVAGCREPAAIVQSSSQALDSAAPLGPRLGTGLDGRRGLCSRQPECMSSAAASASACAQEAALETEGDLRTARRSVQRRRGEARPHGTRRRRLPSAAVRSR